jgi:hypothetical protein
MLLETIKFRSGLSPDPVLNALAFLRRYEGKPDVPMKDAPLALVTKHSHTLVLSGEVPDQRFNALKSLRSFGQPRSRNVPLLYLPNTR